MSDPNKVDWNKLAVRTFKTILKGLSIVMLFTSAVLLSFGAWLHKRVTLKGST